MALRNQPYLPLYVQDFLTDEKLIECSAAATGIYIKIMCIMHKSDDYGTCLLRQKDKQTCDQVINFAYKFSKFLPWDTETIKKGLDELIGEGVLQIKGDVLSQKRMVRDNEISTVRAEAGKKGYFAKATLQANNQAKDQSNSENENENGIEISYKGVLKKVIEENNISLPPGFEPLILEWLKYKSEKGQSYKETGLKTLIKTFLKESDSNSKTGRAMLDYSMSNNYAGLFKEKTSGNNGYTIPAIAPTLTTNKYGE